MSMTEPNDLSDKLKKLFNLILTFYFQIGTQNVEDSSSLVQMKNV